MKKLLVHLHPIFPDIFDIFGLYVTFFTVSF